MEDIRDETNIKLYPYIRKGDLDKIREDDMVTITPYQILETKQCPVDAYRTVCHGSCNWYIKGGCKYKEITDGQKD